MNNKNLGRIEEGREEVKMGKKGDAGWQKSWRGEMGRQVNQYDILFSLISLYKQRKSGFFVLLFFILAGWGENRWDDKDWMWEAPRTVVTGWVYSVRNDLTYPMYLLFLFSYLITSWQLFLGFSRLTFTSKFLFALLFPTNVVKTGNYGWNSKKRRFSGSKCVGGLPS